jgi:Ca2+-binding EF-hand superfamily protein
MLDKKSKGFVKCEDLKRILYGMAQQVNLSEEEVDAMVDALDEKGDGKVVFEGELLSVTRYI